MVYGSEYCWHCGKWVDYPHEFNKVDEIIICPECGKKNSIAFGDDEGFYLFDGEDDD
jgi:DNA-directed RNA polymerase subunit RPC12/RpoP